MVYVPRWVSYQASSAAGGPGPGRGSLLTWGPRSAHSTAGPGILAPTGPTLGRPPRGPLHVSGGAPRHGARPTGQQINVCRMSNTFTHTHSHTVFILHQQPSRETWKEYSNKSKRQKSLGPRHHLAFLLRGHQRADACSRDGTSPAEAGSNAGGAHAVAQRTDTEQGPRGTGPLSQTLAPLSSHSPARAPGKPETASQLCVAFPHRGQGGGWGQAMEAKAQRPPQREETRLPPEPLGGKPASGPGASSSGHTGTSGNSQAGHT